MEQTKKKQCANTAKSKIIQAVSRNETEYNKPNPPLKAESVLSAFLEYGSLNTFEAQSIYGDTCLHTSVSDANRKYGVIFDRVSETVKNRVGRNVSVVRYTPADKKKLSSVLDRLRTDRLMVPGK